MNEKLKQLKKDLEKIKQRIEEIENADKIKLNQGMFYYTIQGKDLYNSFTTAEDVHLAQKVASANNELIQLARIINRDRKINFKEFNFGVKYYICYNHQHEEYSMQRNYSYSFSQIYFRDDCVDKILPIMSENLKAFIRGELQ